MYYKNFKLPQNLKIIMSLECTWSRLWGRRMRENYSQYSPPILPFTICSNLFVNQQHSCLPKYHGIIPR